MEIEHICGDEHRIAGIANMYVCGRWSYGQDIAIIRMKEDIDMYANFFQRRHRVFETDIRYWLGTFVMDGKTHIVFSGPHNKEYRDVWLVQMGEIYNDFKTRGLIYCDDIKFFAESITYWLHDGDEG